MSNRMTTLKILRGAVAAVLVLVLSTAGHADMGRSQGSWGVSPSGAATYSIPIWVQPGPQGIQPALAFSYNSQAGNGTMGVGWGLSGFTSIERCTATLAEDGADRGIAMNSQDRFCLGGNKLRITSGPPASYGSAGAVYQTQLGDFSRVTSVGTAGTGPESWIVHTKSGLIYEFGNTTDSRVVPAGSGNVLRWMLSKVRDRNGNNYVIAYTTDNNVGRVPTSVQWSPLSASTYQYKATFNYENKTRQGDIISATLMAVPLPTKQLLKSVQIGYSASGTDHATQRQYLLDYEESPTTSQSRLKEIKECAETDSVCLKPTSIAYQNGVAGVTSAPTTALASVNSVLAGKFDFNGDGKSDIAYFNGSTWRVAFSNGAGFGTGVDTVISGGAVPVAGRFLSSHQDGFLVNNGGTWNYVGFNGVSFSTTSTGAPVSMGTNGAIVADHDGDGLADLMWSELSGTTGVVRARLNTTTGSASVPTFASSSSVVFAIPTGPAGNPGNIHLINVSRCPLERQCDVNGDGRADLAANVTVITGCGGPGGCTATNNMYELVSSSAGYSGTVTSPGSFSPGFIGLKFNDDRCVDRFLPNSSTLRVSDCTPNGTATSITMPGTSVGVLDWDSDGNTDLLVNSGGTFGVYRSLGSNSSPFSALVTTSIPYNSGCNYFAADIDGDSLDELVCAAGNVTYFTHNGAGSAGTIGTGVYTTQIPDLANNITDGYGVAVSPAYVSTAQSNYTKGEGTALPLVDATDAKIVVGKLTISDGIGGSYDLDYTYKGARRHGRLGGTAAPGITPSGNVDPDLLFGPEGQSVGFEEIRVVDSRSSLQQRTSYEQLFPLTGMAKKAEQYQSNHSTPISKTAITNLVYDLDSTANNRRFFPYVSEIKTETYEVGSSLNGQLITETKRTFGYEDFTYGNLETDTTEVKDLHATDAPSFDNVTWTTQVTFGYDDALTNGEAWCVGFINETEVEHSRSDAGVEPVTRTTGFESDTSDPSKCRVKHKRVEPNDDRYEVVETYDYDSHGNVSDITVVGRKPVGAGYGNMDPRATTITWTDSGQFPESVEDAMGDPTIFGYNFNVGTLESVTDPNLMQTSFDHDVFGRKTRETRPDGTYTTWTYGDCAESTCVNGRHRLTVTQTEFDNQNAAISNQFAYLDAFDRTFVTRTPILGGTQWSETQFDALGRVFKQYMPCAESQPAVRCASHAVTNSYDAVNRLIESSRPESDNAGSGPQSTFYEYAGRIQIVTDALGKETTRVVNVDSTVRQIIDENNYAILFAYDAAGSLIGITDSEDHERLREVSIHYGIRPFMVGAIDSALGQFTRKYNSLGELVEWSDAKGQEFSATYDALSRILTRTEPDNVTEFTYGADSGERNIGKLDSVSAESAAGEYEEQYAYDTHGRLSGKTITIPGQGSFDYAYAYEPNKGWLDTLTYPATSPGNRLVLKYGYQNGILNSVSKANTSTVYWSAEAMNAWGQITEETVGGSTETTRMFDAVNARLESIHSGPSGNTTAYQNLSYLYDLVGNVTQRTAPTLGLVESFIYGDNGDGLYRLGHSTINNGSTTDENLALEYDLTGNITKKTTSGMPDRLVNQSISWTSYNYPLEISSDGQSATFAYGPDRQRWKMQFTQGSTNETTYYIGGLMEMVVGSGTTFRHTILGGNGPVAIYSVPQSGTPALRYVLGDHQGSTDTFVEGSTVTRASFTAFGERRNAATWMGEPTDADREELDGFTRQGYTYQTVLGSLGLNHMNGRVQDATTGRFLSADPFITDPNYTQNFNRYTYVYNNPLTFIDPSGFEICGEWESSPVVIVEGGFQTISSIRHFTPRQCPGYMPGILGYFLRDGYGGPGSGDESDTSRSEEPCSTPSMAAAATAIDIVSGGFYNTDFEKSLLINFLNHGPNIQLSGAQMSTIRQEVADSFARTAKGFNLKPMVGPIVSTDQLGLDRRNVFLGKLAGSEFDGGLGTATGVFHGSTLLSISDRFNFDPKEWGARGDYYNNGYYWSSGYAVEAGVRTAGTIADASCNSPPGFEVTGQ